MKQRRYGSLPSGEVIDEFTLENSRGARAKIITYGGILTEFHVPTGSGETTDIVLGFDSLEEYLSQPMYCGGIIGRVAGRLSGGKFELDGASYSLAINQAPNHLHGGIRGFDKRVWKVNGFGKEADRSFLALSYLSTDGEEGYPGAVQVQVTYSLSEANELGIEYQATTSRATPLSLTHHAYFNLSGNAANPILDHQLQILASTVTPTDRAMTLQGVAVSVDGTASDMREGKILKEVVPSLFENHGDQYLLSKNDSGECREVASVKHFASGRSLKVLTTEPFLQFYTGRSIPVGLKGKRAIPLGMYSGFCLECQRYPDGMRNPQIGGLVLRPGEKYYQKTIYQAG